MLLKTWFYALSQAPRWMMPPIILLPLIRRMVLPPIVGLLVHALRATCRPPLPRLKGLGPRRDPEKFLNKCFAIISHVFLQLRELWKFLYAAPGFVPRQDER